MTNFGLNASTALAQALSRTVMLNGIAQLNKASQKAYPKSGFLGIRLILSVLTQAIPVELAYV